MFRNAAEFLTSLSSKQLDDITLKKISNYIELNKNNPDIISATNSIGDTALILAARANHVAIVEKLLSVNSRNVNATNKNGYTALIAASRIGHTNIVEKLLAVEGIDVTVKSDLNNHHAILVAAATGHVEIVKKLLAAQGIDPNLKGDVGLSALLAAAIKDHKDVVNVLLDDPRVDTTAVTDDENGNNALILAAANSDNDDMVDLLLTHPKSKINVNTQNKHGATALNCAASNNKHKNVTRLLSVEGIEVNNQPISGDTVFMFAAWHGNLELLNTLLNRDDIKVNIQKPTTGGTALTYAVIKGHAHIVKRLLEVKGIDVNVKSKKNGRTVLIGAAKRGHDEIVDMLTPHININDTDNDGDTALHHAAREEKPVTVEKLLGINNINVSEKNKTGQTPLEIAADNVFSHPYSGQYSWLQITALLLLKTKNSDEISEKTLGYLKKHKTELFNHLEIKGNEKDILKEIFENNDSALHRVFYYKNSQPTKGRLLKLHKRYLELAPPTTEQKQKELKEKQDTLCSAVRLIKKQGKNVGKGILEELKTVRPNELTDETLDLIKPVRGELYTAMKKYMIPDDLNKAIKSIFEEKETSVFGKIFWRGNPALHRGNLQTAYTDYQVIITSMLLGMNNRELQQTDIDPILNFVNGDGLFTLSDESLINPLRKWLALAPKDKINPSGVTYLKQYKLITEPEKVNPFEGLAGFGSSFLSKFSIKSKSETNDSNPTKAADLHAGL